MSGNIEAVREYFLVTQDAYERWGAGRYLHFGLDLGERGHLESLEALVDHVADLSEILPGQVLLDSGCGVAGSAVKISKDKNCFVVGTNIMEEQVKSANELIRKEGLESRVFVLPEDFSKMSRIEDRIFDSAIMCESFFHAWEKEPVLSAHSRVLKKGGVFVISDYFKVKDLSGSEQDKLRVFDDGWKGLTGDIRDIEPMMSRNGFRDIQISNLTPRMRASIELAAKSAANHNGNEHVHQGRAKHRLSTVAFNDLVKTEAVGYFVIKARKT